MECEYCGEDAGEKFDVCRNCRNKRNVVIIGNREPSFYINKIVYLGSNHDRIIVKCIYSKLEIFNKMIKQVMMPWGLEEIKRKKQMEKPNEDKEEIEVYSIYLEMIPALRSHKTDLKRKKII